MAVELSEYEQQRLLNIQRNNEILKDLQIDKLPLPKKKVSKPVNKKRNFEDDTQFATRRSARLSDKPVELHGSIDSSESDEEEEYKPIRKPKVLKTVKSHSNATKVDFEVKEPLPTRNEDNTLNFSTHPHFTPNLTPKEVIELGSFGGGYFRPIHSGITKLDYKDDYKEFPKDWFSGVDVKTQATNAEYDPSKNKYGVKAGQGLKEWETSGWIVAQDPRGWFQWYCRYYLGRRSPDDDRQISRWIGVAGPNGRWKKDLISKIMKSGKSWDDKTVSPIVRQTLQHWAYQLTESDFNLY